MDYACRALLAVVFAVAVAGKARSRTAFGAFSAGLADFSWIPASTRNGVALVTLLTETFTAVLLIATARFGALLALALLAVFTIATVRAGRAGSCQCFGVADAAAGSTVGAFLARNALLAVTALAVVLLPDGPVSAVIGLASVAVGAGAGAVVTRWDDLVYLLRR
ncbi:MauE/DoxX family redox-associated membrane protein [Kitasatospora cathayae]|uniref:Methylamine utilisation protein MauE domain-containing protein n=1 Tax=Kitasatospora cathayae TaxID=3004092 RepID=A0ABY7QFK0_9ACTN|nr:MauE/DoxX family redox-associated membrane protein [Kitasatospora sp. HUAS 3-15]WBP91402.1 hypothetical protein O1G21_39675 [Kitasatospora sp. HUAS 3-15]